MTIKFKKLDPRAVVPTKGTPGSAGYDLTAVSITTETNEVGQVVIVYHTGLAMEIPEGYEGEIRPRSSIYKKPLRMCNAPGTIDSDYRGEITVKFTVTTDVVPSVYKEGEKFAQILIKKSEDVQFEESAELSETDRGEGGYGSTGETIASAPTATQSLPETEDMSTYSEPAPEVAAA